MKSSFNVTLSFAGEAAHLAADFDYVCESEFPAAQLAERQYRQHAEPSQQQSRKNAILAAKYVVLCQLRKDSFYAHLRSFRFISEDVGQFYNRFLRILAKFRHKKMATILIEIS